MSYLAIITGDWNDGDYVTSITKGNKNKMDELINAYELTEVFITTYQKENPSEWSRRTIGELMSILLYDYETYEEYCDDWDDLASEEDFETAKESERVYIFDGKAYTEAPLGEALVIEY